MKGFIENKRKRHRHGKISVSLYIIYPSNGKVSVVFEKTFVFLLTIELI